MGGYGPVEHSIEKTQRQAASVKQNDAVIIGFGAGIMRLLKCPCQPCFSQVIFVMSTSTSAAMLAWLIGGRP